MGARYHGPRPQARSLLCQGRPTRDLVSCLAVSLKIKMLVDRDNIHGGETVSSPFILTVTEEVGAAVCFTKTLSCSITHLSKW